MLGAVFARKALKKLNPERYNGAGLLGLKGLVFKSHGGANAYAFEWAIKRAYDAAHNNVQEHLSALIAELMPSSPVTAPLTAPAAAPAVTPASALDGQRQAQ